MLHPPGANALAAPRKRTLPPRDGVKAPTPLAIRALIAFALVRSAFAAIRKPRHMLLDCCWVALFIGGPPSSALIAA